MDLIIVFAIGLVMGVFVGALGIIEGRRHRDQR